MATPTVCGTDVHILKGEYPVQPGLTLGHEPVGTHRFTLDRIADAYELFGHQRDGVLKVAITTGEAG